MSGAERGMGVVMEEGDCVWVPHFLHMRAFVGFGVWEQEREGGEREKKERQGTLG